MTMVPPGFAIPLVDTATDIFDTATMTALDDRYNDESMFSLIRTAAYNFTSGAGTPIAWSSAIEESTEGPTSLAGFTTSDWIEFTCTEPGLYLIDAVLTATTVAGSIACDIYKNGSLRRATFGASTASSAASAHTTVGSRFDVGDTFKVHARSGSTIAGAIATGANGLTVAKL